MNKLTKRLQWLAGGSSFLNTAMAKTNLLSLPLLPLMVGIYVDTTQTTATISTRCMKRRFGLSQACGQHITRT